MKRSNPILLILNIPPPYGGGEVRAGIVAEYFKDHSDFEIFKYSRPRGNKSTQGRATWRNFLFGLVYIGRCCGLILKMWPSKLFVSIPKNFGAFTRIIPVILLASLMRVKVCGELAGARFLFLDGGWQKRIGLFVLRRLHSIRFLGDHVLEDHEVHHLKNPVVFSNGIRIPRDRAHVSESGEGTVQLLAVGALNRSKGTGRIVEAVALCRKQGMNVTCTFVGEWSDPSFKQEVSHLIETNQLGDYIHFAGLVIGEKKWGYFRPASILVHPTSWDGQPLTILEAIGMGLAVISTPVGAIPDTVVHGRNGVLLKENTPEALCSAIADMYNNPLALAEMQKCNRSDFDKRFTVNIYLNNLKHWLETV